LKSFIGLTYKTIKIINAKYKDGYKLAIEFDDNTTQIVDFEEFLKSSHHPSIQKNLNLELFKKFEISYGDLHWNNYDLCFPSYDLYLGRCA
jgi:hypothetical protein